MNRQTERKRVLSQYYNLSYIYIYSVASILQPHIYYNTFYLVPHFYISVYCLRLLLHSSMLFTSPTLSLQPNSSFMVCNVFVSSGECVYRSHSNITACVVSPTHVAVRLFARSRFVPASPGLVTMAFCPASPAPSLSSCRLLNAFYLQLERKKVPPCCYFFCSVFHFSISCCSILS